MKILLDMNIPLKYVALFEKKGFMSLLWSDVGEPT
jgi:predicted nuclease of predicted toxin-antitoxin system